MVSSLRTSLSSLSAWADSLGGIGALMCAIHCAALPFVLAALPLASLGWFASGDFERGFLLFAASLGFSSLWLGYRRHRALSALLMLMTGLLVIAAAIGIDLLHDSSLWHASAMTAGGALIALAHWLNLRLSRATARYGSWPGTRPV